MTPGADTGGEEGMRSEAHAWIVRMHGPDADSARDAFEAWLDAAPAHRETYAELQRHWDRAKFLTHTRTGQSRDLSSVAVWYRRPGPRRAAVAALAVFLVAAGLAFVRGPSRPGEPPTVAYGTKTGEVRTVSFADGSRVTLDAGSRVEFTMDPGMRQARLIEGAARFDVKPDPERSFAVVTNGGTLTSGGGRFDVMNGTDLVRITPLSGTLRFKTKPGSPGLGSQASLAILPGQRLTIAGRLPAALAKAPATGAQDWTVGMLSFDGERLADAIAQMNRHNSRKIVLTDASLSDRRITGAFHAGDPEGFTRTVATMLAINRREGPGIIELGREK